MCVRALVRGSSQNNLAYTTYSTCSRQQRNKKSTHEPCKLSTHCDPLRATPRGTRSFPFQFVSGTRRKEIENRKRVRNKIKPQWPPATTACCCRRPYTRASSKYTLWCMPPRRSRSCKLAVEQETLAPVKGSNVHFAKKQTHHAYTPGMVVSTVIDHIVDY